MSRKCSICNKPFTNDAEWERRHSYHADDCPNHQLELNEIYYNWEMEEKCDCDFLAHADCCPICAKGTP